MTILQGVSAYTPYHSDARQGAEILWWALVQQADPHLSANGALHVRQVLSRLWPDDDPYALFPGQDFPGVSSMAFDRSGLCLEWARAAMEWR